MGDVCVEKDVLREEEVDVILNGYEMRKRGIGGGEVLNGD